MKKRIIAFLVCLIMIFVCGCGNTAEKTDVKTEDGKSSNIQTIISMNPSVVSNDGTVLSARKSISDCMASDYQSGKISLYDNTNWQWLYAASDNTFICRTVRGIESFKDGSGKSVKNTPYVYTVTDDRTSSLAVYDTSKMEITGYDGNSVAPSGILMTFTGTEKESFCYIANNDCTLTLCDTDNGNISLIKSIASADTDILKSDDAVGVVIGISLNNKLLWQEVIGNKQLLGNEVTSVAFPTISNIALSAGDAFVITVQLVNSVDGIERGYLNITDEYTHETQNSDTGVSVVTKTIKVAHEVEVKDDNKAEKGIYFLNKYGVPNFTVIASANADAEISNIANGLRNSMQEILGTDVVYRRDDSEFDSEYKILVGDTSFSESQFAKNEIFSNRTNNAADFIIRLVGKNVVINALNAFSLQMAVDYFVINYCTDVNALIPEGLNYISSKHSGVESLTIAGNDISKYKIVYSHVPSLIETQAVDYLKNELIKLTGNELEVVNDNSIPSKYEILIGTTNRTSLNYNVKATVNSGKNYIVKVSDDKLIFEAEQAYGVNAAVQAFIKKIKGVSSLSDGYSFSGKYDGEYSLLDGYKLVWSDEFNGTEISDPWTFDGQVSRETPYGGYQKDIVENASVSDGALIQRTFTNDGKNFYGSSLRTDGKKPLWWKFGYCEIRVKYPTQVGPTVGFCLFGTRHPIYEAFLEFDIVENFSNPYKIRHTVHGWGSTHKSWHFPENFNYKEGTDELVPFGLEYHTIGIEWESDSLTFYIDGEVTGTMDCSDPALEFFHAPVYIIISNSVGFFDDAEPAKDFYEDFSYTDYIRIYQKSDNGSSINRPN